MASRKSLLLFFALFGDASQSLADDSCLMQVRSSKVLGTSVSGQHEMKLGVISYWSPSSGYYDSLPNGSLAVINPMNGVFDGQSTETLAPNIHQYQAIVTSAAARNIRVLGYVPTAYFNHNCTVSELECQTLDRVGKQIEKYLEVFPGLAGIFFDEVAPRDWDCDKFVPEYEALRKLVRDHSSTVTIAWNAAVTSDCAVAGASRDEILVLFEAEAEKYGNEEYDDILNSTASKARSRGVKTWHLVHTVNNANLQSVINKARTYQVDWFFATNIGGDWQKGENTWGSPPRYWDKLKMEFGWSPPPTTSPPPTVVPSELSGIVDPAEIPSGSSAIITLNRPTAQCCNAWDWIGIYKNGSTDRLGFVHSGNDADHRVRIPLDSMIADLGDGDYEFKYSTGIDNWVMHDLAPATLAIHSEPFARMVPAGPADSSSILTLNRPKAQCCSAWDWVGIYKRGSPDRIRFVHSHNEADHIVEIPLKNLICDDDGTTCLDDGEYDFKYSTGSDGWKMHDLAHSEIRR